MIHYHRSDISERAEHYSHIFNNTTSSIRLTWSRTPKTRAAINRLLQIMYHKPNNDIRPNTSEPSPTICELLHLKCSCVEHNLAYSYIHKVDCNILVIIQETTSIRLSSIRLYRSQRIMALIPTPPSRPHKSINSTGKIRVLSNRCLIESRKSSIRFPATNLEFGIR